MSSKTDPQKVVIRNAEDEIMDEHNAAGIREDDNYQVVAVPQMKRNIGGNVPDEVKKLREELEKMKKERELERKQFDEEKTDFEKLKMENDQLKKDFEIVSLKFENALLKAES